MPEWTFDVALHIPKETFCCEGEDWSDAHSNAQEVADKLAKKVGHGAQASVSITRQLGEPWVKPFGGHAWYDLHGPGDVICLERSTGNAFTQADIDLLKERIESCGLSVVDSWNGAGCGSVSFKLKGRDPVDAPFTPEQVKALLAPRPKEVADVGSA
jgi:hypothetical protein